MSVVYCRSNPVRRACASPSCMRCADPRPAGGRVTASRCARCGRGRRPVCSIRAWVGWLVGCPWNLRSCSMRGGLRVPVPPPPFRSFFSTLLARAALHLHRRPEDTHSVLGSSYVLRLPSYSLENRPSYSLGIVVEKWRKPADSVLPRRASGGAWLGREGRPAGRWKGDGN